MCMLYIGHTFNYDELTKQNEEKGHFESKQKWELEIKERWSNLLILGIALVLWLGEGNLHKNRPNLQFYGPKLHD